MPWTPQQFKERHNSKLRGPAAAKAAEQATAMVKSGVPEGIAIATANKTGNRMMRNGYSHSRKARE
jgi:uncharacterized protein YdaT